MTVFPVSAFNPNPAVLDATVGITGYTIEDFEDTSLVPGLSITFSEFVNGNNTPAGVPDRTITSLPNLLDATNLLGFIPPNQWDGTRALTNTRGGNNVLDADPAPPVARVTTFTIAGGATSFGVGLSNFQSLSTTGIFPPVTDHDLLVNGVSLGTIESLAGSSFTPGGGRNAYVRIDATGGDVITSVGFRNRNDGPAIADVQIYDRVAFATLGPWPDPTNPIPEPASVLLLGAGAAGLVAVRRRAPGRPSAGPGKPEE